jgi:hypothetical protein
MTPQTPERKRDYMRDYMRQQRAAAARVPRGGGGPLGYPPGGTNKSGAYERVLVPRDLDPSRIYGMNAPRMAQYMAYIGARGRTLEAVRSSVGAIIGWRMVPLAPVVMTNPVAT